MLKSDCFLIASSCVLSHVFVRYAGLRRRLLVDPHVSKDGSNSPDLVIDNPLSQNPGKLLFSSVLS